jgi:hypothetical protein
MGRGMLHVVSLLRSLCAFSIQQHLLNSDLAQSKLGGGMSSGRVACSFIFQSVYTRPHLLRRTTD